VVHYERNSTIYCMKTFSDREIKLVRKLRDRPPQTTLQIQEPCLLHSYCNPLPLFRVYKIDDTTFEAQWNEHHKQGTTQVFRFENANGE
jgi:hypothetical protein